MTQILRLNLIAFNSSSSSSPSYFSTLFFVFFPLVSQSALQAPEAALAQLPELPSAQLGLGSAPDRLPVGAADESPAEAVHAAAHRAAGEAHADQQARLQLVSGPLHSVQFSHLARRRSRCASHRRPSPQRPPPPAGWCALVCGAVRRGAARRCDGCPQRLGFTFFSQARNCWEGVHIVCSSTRQSQSFTRTAS